MAQQTTRSEYGPKIVTVRGCKNMSIFVRKLCNTRTWCQLFLLSENSVIFTSKIWIGLLTGMDCSDDSQCSTPQHTLHNSYKTDGYLYTHHYCLHNTSLSLYSEKFPVLLLLMHGLFLEMSWDSSSPMIPLLWICKI